MTGLKRYQRDLELAVRLGDHDLRVLSEEEVCALANAHLARPGTPICQSAELGYVRWKPGVGLLASYELRLADGSGAIVTVKQHRGEKLDGSAVERGSSKHVERVEGRFEPLAVLSERGLVLWTFPADRVLKGVPRAADSRRMARVVEALGHGLSDYVSKSRSQAVLLRYKAERRAVFRMDAVFRLPSGEEHARPYSLRAIAPAELARIEGLRSTTEHAASVLPARLWSDLEYGLTIEEWCPGRAPAPSDFSQARRAAVLLARLHGEPGRGSAPGRALERTALHELFARVPRLERLARELPAPPQRLALCTVHGDFHPDQMLFEHDLDSGRLIDLDALRLGEPSEDLAAWIADQLVADAGTELEGACEPLYEGYREGGGRLPAAERLRALVVDELVHRAAASLRRLETGAVEKAERCLARALHLASPEGSKP